MGGRAVSSTNYRVSSSSTIDLRNSSIWTVDHPALLPFLWLAQGSALALWWFIPDRAVEHVFGSIAHGWLSSSSEQLPVNVILLLQTVHMYMLMDYSARRNVGRVTRKRFLEGVFQVIC